MTSENLKVFWKVGSSPWLDPEFIAGELHGQTGQVLFLTFLPIKVIANFQTDFTIYT